MALFEVTAYDKKIWEEELRETYQLMFPGKDVKALMFISGKTGIDQNNAYLVSSQQRTRVAGPVLLPSYAVCC